MVKKELSNSNAWMSLILHNNIYVVVRCKYTLVDYLMV